MSMENLGPYTNFHELNQDWFLQEFNKLIAQWKAMQKNFDNLQDAFNDLKSYVQDYFKNLDVQDEINNKLNSMINDGTLLTIISPTIITSTSNWLTEHITNPSNPPIDNSFTISNTAADSKTIGRFAFLSSRSNVAKPPFNLNDCIPNRIYILSISEAENTPVPIGGVCWSFSYDSNSSSIYPQYYHTTKNELYVRFNDYNTGWSEWKKIGYDNSIINFMSAHVNISSSPFNLNDCTPNRIYVLSISDAENIPVPIGGVCWSFSYDSNSSSIYPQYYHTTKNELYVRFNDYNTGWSEWKKIGYDEDISKINYNISLFTTVGEIGDSYASGVVYSDTSTSLGDNFKISWLQQLARHFGFTGLNFSTGGLTTRSWLTSSRGLSLLNSSANCDLILLTLGINDYYNIGLSYLGTPSDMDSGADTFYGNYAKIINAVINKNSKTRMILFTIINPNNNNVVNEFNKAISNIAEHFSIPLKDQNKNKYFKSNLYKNNLIGGHPTAINYNGMSIAFSEMISEAMEENQTYFNKLFL